ATSSRSPRRLYVPTLMPVTPPGVALSAVTPSAVTPIGTSRGSAAAGEVGGAHQAGGGAQLGQPHLGHGAVAAAGQPFLERRLGPVEEQVGGAGHAAAEDEAGGVEHGGQVGHALAQPVGEGGERG